MPAASDNPSGSAPDRASGGLPVRFRPVGVRVAVLGFGVLLGATLLVVWLTMPAQARASFSVGQDVTIAAMLLGIGAVGHALVRCRVDADRQGLVVVNGYRTHRFAWEQVVAVSLRPGSPWAVLDLTDGTSQAALGIQGSDGLRARQQTRRLRGLIEAHAATEPPGRRREADGHPADPGDDPDG
jgi:hypothetical protein